MSGRRQFRGANHRAVNHQVQKEPCNGRPVDLKTLVQVCDRLKCSISDVFGE